MKNDQFKSALETSFLYNDLSKKLKENVVLFLANTNLSAQQKIDLVKILEETYNEGFTGSMYVDSE